jgi:dCMP deaminase
MFKSLLLYCINFLIPKNNQNNETNNPENIKKLNKENKYHKKYLEIAQKISELSHSNKKKVGTIIVKNSSIISDGYNGTPYGYDNQCEDLDGNTKWYTLHSEANAITKLVRIGGLSAEDAILYSTLSPCKECAKLILQCGIKKVYYLEEYRDISGINFLSNSGIEICKFIDE